MHKEEFTILIDKWLDGSIKAEERDQLALLLQRPEVMEQLGRTMDVELLNKKYALEPGKKARTNIDNAIERELEKYSLLEKVNSDAAGRRDEMVQGQPVHRIHFLRTAWFRYAAAIIILFGIGAYLWNNTSVNREKPGIVEQTDVRHDVQAPASMLATITLSNGKQVPLDSIQKGMIAKEGDVTIEKLQDGRIVYKGISEGEMLYNTISVPRGSKIASLTMSDGTIVFLNTASSLRYPVAFSGKERKVSITGEAYFEVAKDKTKKFIVETEGMTTEVLGTHFNVNGYDDETARAVTLLEGSIKVSTGSQSVMVSPGQQALLQQNGITINPKADVSQVMAWKNGYFVFNNADIPTVMKQLSRWYDVDVVYENGVPDVQFSGEIQRKLSLSQVIKGLKKMGVNCTIEDKKLIIHP